MRIHKLVTAISFCFIVGHSMAQSEQTDTYRKFAVYAGAGPSYFFNNLQLFNSNIKPLAVCHIGEIYVGAPAFPVKPGH